MRLFCDEETYAFAKSVENELATAFIVSQIEIVEGGEGEYHGDLPGVSVTVLHAEGEKCPRCWSYSHTIGSDPEHPEVCARCAKALQ